MSLDDDFERPFEILEPPQWGALRELSRANKEYFSARGSDEYAVRIAAALDVISDCMSELRPLYREIADIAPSYDFDDITPGNGYRSFLILVDKCVLYCGAVCRQIYVQRDSILFRKSHHTREIESCSQLLASLCTCLHHLKTLHSWSHETTNDGKPSLFTSDDHSPRELLSKAENINQYCFYGRCLGFQFCDGLRNTLKILTVAMASFSETYYTNGTMLGRCTNFVKYFLDPESRARRIVNISQRADIYFCQAFWHLNESNIVQMYPALVMPSLAINQVISVPPEELILPTIGGTTSNVPIPSSHIGKKPIHVKLLSSKRRVGMVGSARVGGELLGPSEVLVIHCHGGGFVAQTSKSHEVYLRNWVLKLDVPLLSIDYSLAPEAPFPRALEEVLYGYAWALKHSTTLLGTTAKKVIFIGDSAGANLLLAATIRCIELDIKRPDGIFMAYTPIWVEFIPSPSRLLCLADPLLPFGFMMRCLKAYAATDPTKNNSREKCCNEAEDTVKSDTESFAEVSESDLIALALSPNGDETNENRLGSMASDLTLNSVSLVDADGISGNEIHNETTSHEYIRKFVDMYKNVGFGKSATSANGVPVRESSSSDGEKSWSLFGWSLGGSERRESRELDTDDVKTPSDEFVFSVPRDPLLSPYLASDSVLERMPPVKILSMDLDPCLDDCVMFARKLKSLGNDVSLDILPGLPHGFLNLIMVSKEASDGAELCCKRIQELIDLA